MTPADVAFDPYLWHDDTLYGLQLRLGDHEAGDWRAELVLDVDHIVEWLKSEDRRIRFRVAPASMTFHEVTDLRVAIDWGDSGHLTMLHAGSIDRIEREPVVRPRITSDRPYWRWRIVLNWLAGGGIVLGASGLSLELRAEPVLQDQQQLGRPGS